jgi:choline dehydrogenase-like flavoprotein
MIVDARRDGPTAGLECDVCIVGAGPAGIALARDLDDDRRSICVLESGGLGFDARVQSLLASEPPHDAYPPLESTRIGALGGSTHVWAGWCRPLDPIDFERRVDILASGWPLTRAQLDPFYDRAHQVLGLGAFDYDPHEWEKTAQVARLPLQGDAIDAILFRKSHVRFGRTHVEALRRSRSIRTYLHASAVALRFAADRQVAAVEVAATPTRRFEVRPRVLVLAAGGIENARLLLLSANGKRGPGNEHDVVGRYFTEHMYVDGGVFVPSKPHSLDFFFARAVGHGLQALTARGAVAPSSTVMRRDSLLNCALFFRPAYESDPAFADERVEDLLALWDMVRSRAVPYRRRDALLRAAAAPHAMLRALWSRIVDRGDAAYWRLRALCECSADPANRIELGSERDAFGRPKVRVRWRPRDVDLRSMRAAHVLFDEALRKAGLGRLELLPAQNEQWQAAAQVALHHLGTTRMHDDPTQGVVDCNARVHGVDNLYVAGGSVFPTGGFANPTLTILALTLRLGTHLRAKL